MSIERMTYVEAFATLETHPDFKERYKKVPLEQLHKCVEWLAGKESHAPECVYVEVIGECYLSLLFSDEYVAECCDLIQRAVLIRQKENWGKSYEGTLE